MASSKARPTIDRSRTRKEWELAHIPNFFSQVLLNGLFFRENQGKLLLGAGEKKL
jgi:hypothetical protein